MATLTNHMNLPQAIVDAISNDPYTRGTSDISVTQLIGPARKVALEITHADEITEDASDRIWSLMGQSIHAILERANRKGIAERRLSIEIEGWKISGGMDLYDEDGTLTDYKTTSAYAVKDGGKDEWEKQLNVYAEILRANGSQVKALKVVALLRDWSKMEAKRNPEYPQAQVAILSVPLWPEEIAKRYIRERVIVHQQARISLPLCTDDERWARPDVWAVMKKGQKKAVKLHGSAESASLHANQDPSLSVVHRPGVNTRCENYCSVAKFCTQNQTLKTKTENEYDESA